MTADEDDTRRLCAIETVTDWEIALGQSTSGRCQGVAPTVPGEGGGVVTSEARKECGVLLTCSKAGHCGGQLQLVPPLAPCALVFRGRAGGKGSPQPVEPHAPTTAKWH